MEEILLWTGVVLLGARVAGFPGWGRTLDQIKRSRPPTFAPGARRPVATLVLSCRNVHPGLERAARRLLRLDHPTYDVVFATQDAEDPAHAALRRIVAETPGRRARHVRFAFGGVSGRRAQKLDNHLAALACASRDSEAYVFVDDDGEPSADLLTRLLAPLEHPRVGMTTGWPWLPRPRGFFTCVAALWFVGLLSGTGTRRVANGVAMAVRRDVFEGVGVRAVWERALTDDLSLASAVRARGLEVVFVPQVMLAQSARHRSFRSLWIWIVRQITLARLYAPGVWRTSFVAYALPSLGAWLGIAWLGVAGPGSTAAWLLLAQVPLSLLDTFAGLLLVRDAFRRAHTRADIAEGLPPSLALWMPFVTLMIFPVYLRSWLVPRMRWGDYMYRFTSPLEVRVERADGLPLTDAPAPSRRAA